MDPLDFLKQKLNQGLSDVEQWGSDAGNDVTHALGSVFGGNNQSQGGQQQTLQQNSPQQNVGGLSVNNPLSLQNQQQPQQNNTLKVNLNQAQPGQPNQAPTGQAAPLNTKLVNFNPSQNFIPLKNPALAAQTVPQGSIKTNNMPGSFNSTPHPTNQNPGAVGNFLGTLGNDTIKPLFNQVKTIATALPGAEKVIQGANLTDLPNILHPNTTEIKQGVKQLRPIGTQVRQIAQGTADIPYTAVKSIVSPRTTTPPALLNNPVAHFIFGKQPVQSLQQIGANAGGGAKGAGAITGTSAADLLTLAGLGAGIKGLAGAKDVPPEEIPPIDTTKITDPDIQKAVTQISKPTTVEPIKVAEPEGAVGKNVSGVGEPVDNGKTFYHGTNNADLKTLSDLKSGRTTNKSATNMVYVTENPEIANNFGKNVISGQIYGKHLDISKLGNNAWDPINVPKDLADYQTNPLLSPRDRRVFEQQYLRGQGDNRIIDATPDIQKYLVSKGYSTVTVPRVGSDVNGARSETVIINKDGLTKPTPPIGVGKNVGESPTKIVEPTSTQTKIASLPTEEDIAKGTKIAPATNDISSEFSPEAMVRSGLAETPEQAKTLIAQNEAENDFFPSDAEFKALTSEGGLPSDTDALQREQDLEEQLGPKAWKQLSPDIKKQMLGTGGPERARQLTPEEAVTRVARGVKGRPGTYDETVKAFMNKGLTDKDGNLFQYNSNSGPRSIPYDQIPAEVSKILEENDVTPIGGRHGEYTAGQPQVATNPFPVNKEEDVIQPMKPEKGIVKIESLGTRLSKMGAPGRELLKRIDNARAEESIIDTRLNDATPTLDKLSKDQVNELFALHKSKGELQTDDPMVQQASDELRSIMPKAQQDALQAGLPVGDRGEWYLPQSFKPGFFDKPNQFDAAVKHLVKSGQAADSQEAIQLLNLYKTGDYMGGKVFSNLERQRNFDIPGYRTDVGSIKSYFRNYSRRIAQTHQFGVNNEEVTDLINRANRSGQDAEAMQNVFNKYWNPDRGTSGGFGKTANVALRGQQILQLQKSFIAHTPQGFANIGSERGFIPYFKGLAQTVFSKTDRSYAHAAGVDAENLHDTGTGPKIINPFMKALEAVRNFHRTTAFIVAKNDILKMADAGDEAGLRKYGIDGDLPRDPNGRINLTNEQMFQASHNLADSTIFTSDPIQGSALVQGNAGRFIGQYRGQYVFKQAGFINKLVQQAAHGDPAPLIRYLGVAVPVSGVVVTALKQLFEGKNPVTQTKKNPKSEVEQVFANSGVETAGAGGGEAVTNEVEYHNPNESWQNIANTVSPTAGNVVETGQNVDNAARGNKNPLIKQASSYVPGGSALLNSRIGKDVGYNPPKVVTPAEQQFYNAWDKATTKVDKALNPSFSQSANPTAIAQAKKTRDAFNYLSDHNHTSNGTTILNTKAQSMSNAQVAVANPTALKLYQQREQSLPDHDTIYDLPFNKLQAYEAYEALGPGDPNKTVMEQKDPWLVPAFGAEQTWFNKQQALPGTVTPPGYVQYPPITPAQDQMMSQVTQLASIQTRTPAQETQLENLENNTDLQAAFTLLANYTNAQRASIPGGEYSPIPNPAQNLTPAQNTLLQQESALPSNTGAKSAFIKANQDAWNSMEQILAQQTQFDVEKYGGVVEQGGTEPNLLKDEYSLGTDIAKGTNAAGQSTYVLDPALAYSGGTQGGYNFAGSSGSGSSSNPLVPMPKIKRGKTPKMRKPPKLHGFRAPHIRKSANKPVKVSGAHPVQVAKPTSVVRLKAA